MYKDLDEQTLATYCSQKDRMAEEELYRRYAARVNMLCKRYTKDSFEANDLMLESLIQALEKIDTYKYTGKGSLYGWISRIAINKAINQIKRQRWRIVPLNENVKDNLPEPTEEEIIKIPGEKLCEWIAGLSNLNRTVFNLYCIDGFSHQEIGRMLGISERGSTSVLAKARKQLKGKIQQYLKEQER